MRPRATHKTCGGPPESGAALRQRLRAETALAKTTACLNGIIASAMDAIIATDADQRIVLFNAAAEKMFQVAATEALGQNLDRFIPERFHAAHSHHVEHFAGTGESTRRMGRLGAVRGRRANGEEFPAEVAISTAEVAGERLFTAILRDLTERQQADDTRARLAAIVEASEDAILSKSLAGEIESWNEGAARLFGYAAREIIGQPINLIIPLGYQAQETEIIERLRRGERVEHYETVRRHKDGRPLEVSLSASPIRGAGGAMIGVSTIIRDITERKHAEAELRASERLAHRRLVDLQAALDQLAAAKAELETRVQERTAELEQRVAELRAFSYSLSHDLRAPVRAIRNFIHLVSTEHAATMAPPAAELLERALGAAQRMDTLIQDVLTLSSLSLQPITLETADLEQLVAGLLRERPDLQEPNAAVTIQSPLLPVRGHPASLTQCLSNLLGNAVKFVRPGVKPQIRLWTELRPRGGETHGPEAEAPSPGSNVPSRESSVPPPAPIENQKSKIKNRTVRLWVEDNGIGIPREAQARVFEIFQRVHTGYEGTGIGLAIVRKAVERMGGQAGLESEPDQGARFWLDLPAA